MTHHPRRHPRRGVTLLEMLVVLAIIALVIGLGAPRLIDSFGRARSQTAEAALASLRGAVQLYFVDTGRYPSEAEGLAALMTAPAGVPGWRGPYVDGDEDLTDPWGRLFLFRAPGEDGEPFDLVTLGRDGQPGGSGEDSDISL
ncbi:type II secretion system major pseudopilin GspG [Rubellimicrobium roseum]|uniref:Type II secretion system core protein G n=1 Tax=Rubellimicrobium roseum TaxID=687525 RepID=A0A5C4NBP3_9RHOB|nr:type II secretion system major pseudopilin GspG [Rubellimicrobium roseum]TNC71350.1 type II secretion system protein GspG [Rubellimicrobium roseum]